MKAVTIDNLDIKEHIRWAKDREIFDAALVHDTHQIAQHPEISGLSAIFPSQLEELFNWEKGVNPFANFAVPYNVHQFSRHLFTYRLFHNIHWKQANDDEDASEEDESEGKSKPEENLLLQIKAVRTSSHNSTIFEKDKSTLISLLESIQSINKMLEQITSRKLQYQKG